MPASMKSKRALRNAGRLYWSYSADTKTSAPAAGATPTKAEFDKVVDDVVVLFDNVNGLIENGRKAGLITPIGGGGDPLPS